MATKQLRLALLVCDTPIQTVREKYGTYLDVFKSFLDNSLSSNSEDLGTIEWTLEGFDVVQGVYPSPSDLEGDNAFDGILITGSSATAHEDVPWINALVEYMAKTIKERPKVKIVGICFGHQIIARAMGGTLERNPKGWEIATTEIELTKEGKRVLDMDSGRLQIIQMHRDHVTAMPPSFELLGKTSIAPVQGMTLCYPSTQEIHVFTVQGHPEFNPDIVGKIVDAREASGVMDAETVKGARGRTNKRDDGNGPIGRAIWKVLAAQIKD